MAKLTAAFIRRMIREKPLAALGLFIFVFFVFVAIFADVLAPYGMNETNVVDRLQSPSVRHWLGTDDLGRDLLSRLIYGARISMTVGVASALLSALVSTAVGLVSGYVGGVFDLVVQRVVDAIMSFPILILVLVVMSLTGTGMIQVIVVMGLRSGIVTSRVARADVMRIKENVYIQAAKVIGSSTAWIMWRHILPNILPTIIVLFATRMPVLILLEASLSFLGFGVPPPAPSWGGMLGGSSLTYMFEAPWMAVWPGLVLAVVVFGVNMLGDGVRDMLDPRMRGGGGRFGVRPVGKELAELRARANGAQANSPGSAQ
jgi:peptide/nickel transport system permease protein